MDELEWERRLSHTEDRSKSNSHRLDKVEKRQSELTTLVKSVATIAQKQADMESDMREMKSDVKSLLAVPAERWKTVVTAAITAAVGVLIGVMM
ncbi:MAG: hypothetical protein IJP14_02995 [Clostridia bacterium]|nr:hypothetical protein [Clostridia bacterium]